MFAAGFALMRGPTLMLGLLLAIPVEVLLEARRGGPGVISFDPLRLGAAAVGTVVVVIAGTYLSNTLYAERIADIRSGANGTGGLGDGAGAEFMHGGEFLPAALMQDGNEIDDMVGPLHGAVDRPAHPHIGLYRLDLAYVAERLQMAGKVGPPAGDPDAIAALGQRAHDMAADKA